MSSFSEGQIHQLADALEGVGFSAGDVTLLGQFKNLSGIRDVVRGVAEIMYPERKWREEDGVIYFSVTSDGATGEQWIARLERRGKRLDKYAKSVLRSPEFRPTSGVTTEVGVLKGALFADSERVTNKIRAEAERRNWATPNAEVACLIREMFSDEELAAMGLWRIVVMHEPINDSDGGPDLLSVNRGDDGRWLSASVDGPGGGWYRGRGFAFSVPQV